MSVIEFSFLDKQKAEKYLPDLFAILHSNMSLIAPTYNSYKEDFEIWYPSIIPALQKEQRQIVLMFVDSTLVGYFQYYINIDKCSLMMEEIQIVKAMQGRGIFSAFYKWLVRQLPEDILYVEAYANKKNHKSQAILKHMGLLQSGENKSGNSFYYKGEYANLLIKYR